MKKNVLASSVSVETAKIGNNESQGEIDRVEKLGSQIMNIKTPQNMQSQDINIKNMPPIKVDDDFELPEILQMIRQKANREEVKHIANIKANKIDQEHQMKAIDILHR